MFRRSVELFAENLSAQLSAVEVAPVHAPEALPEAPPLVHEEPTEEPTPVLEAPPLSPGVAAPAPVIPIAPTAVPDVGETARSEDGAETPAVEKAGASATTRIMLVAGIVVVVGALIYYIALQSPPPV